MVLAVRLTNDRVRFICTDNGQHAPTDLGSYHAEYTLGTPEATFIQSRRAGGEQLTGDALKMDERCPRCGRNARYNAKTLRAICRAAAQEPYDDRQLFAVDVSLGGHC